MKEAVAALRELVELKAIKRKIEARTATDDERERYKFSKEQAWNKAEAILHDSPRMEAQTLTEDQLWTLVRVYHGFKTEEAMVEQFGYGLELNVEKMRQAFAAINVPATEPSGWTLAPREPTEDMIRASRTCLNGVNLLAVAKTEDARIRYKHVRRYEAMLHAKPWNHDGTLPELPDATTDGAAKEKA